MRRGWGILLAMVALVPLGAAQQHAHDGSAMVVIAHDGPPDGRAVVGNVAHFAVLLLGEDGLPAFHQDILVEVHLNGLLLFATTPASGHDYDGVFGFDVVFPAPGTYTVTARADELSPEAATFEGYVVPLDAPVPASLSLSVPERMAPGEPVALSYHIQDGGGQLIPHTDAIVEIRDVPSGRVLYRIHTHSHEDVQELTVAFPRPGPHEVRVLAYTAFPTADAPQFAAFTASQIVEVPHAAPALGLAPAVPVPPGDLNQVDQGEAGPEYVLVGTYDPYTVVGPHSQARLNAIVLNATTMQPVQHVNFRATLTDPLGRVLLASESLHEYDGILEVVVGDAALPGQYMLQVAASRGAWEGTATLRYTVAPPVLATAAGPQVVELLGAEGVASGAPAALELFAHDLAGMPFSHSEVDLLIIEAREGAAPFLATKLHTHADGRFPFTVTFPAPGDYDVIATPFPLEAAPTPAFFGAAPGEAPVFRLQVAAGPALPSPVPLAATSAPDDAPRAAPGAELGWVALGAVGAALLLRRRD